MLPQRRLTGIMTEGTTARRTPFETRKPEFGGVIGRC